MKASRCTVPLLLIALGCGSVTPAGGGGGGSGSAGRGGGSGTTGQAGLGGSAGSGAGAGTAGAAGTGGSAAGGSGTAGRGGTGGSGSAGAGGAGGSSQCPPGQVWCSGCTPGTGSCSVGGCPGVACPPIDASIPPPDAAQAKCADVTTLAECDARTDCHSVFVDPQNCRCVALGCCAHFSRCADGDSANCKGPAACDALSPHCEGPYVVGFANACYEGCVRATECAP